MPSRDWTIGMFCACGGVLTAARSHFNTDDYGRSFRFADARRRLRDVYFRETPEALRRGATRRSDAAAAMLD